MLHKRLGQRIADLRKNRRLTQVQFAKALGCSVEFISLVERGVNALSVARLEGFERGIYERTKQVFEYFELPFDVGPPP